MKRLLGALRNWVCGERSNHREYRHATPAQPLLESLETRQLLSATGPSISLLADQWAEVRRTFEVDVFRPESVTESEFGAVNRTISSEAVLELIEAIQWAEFGPVLGPLPAPTLPPPSEGFNWPDFSIEMGPSLPDLAFLLEASPQDHICPDLPSQLDGILGTASGQDEVPLFLPDRGEIISFAVSLLSTLSLEARRDGDPVSPTFPLPGYRPQAHRRGERATSAFPPLTAARDILSADLVTPSPDQLRSAMAQEPPGAPAADTFRPEPFDVGVFGLADYFESPRVSFDSHNPFRLPSELRLDPPVSRTARPASQEHPIPYRPTVVPEPCSSLAQSSTQSASEEPPPTSNAQEIALALRDAPWRVEDWSADRATQANNGTTWLARDPDPGVLPAVESQAESIVRSVCLCYAVKCIEDPEQVGPVVMLCLAFGINARLSIATDLRNGQVALEQLTGLSGQGSSAFDSLPPFLAPAAVLLGGLRMSGTELQGGLQAVGAGDSQMLLADMVRRVSERFTSLVQHFYRVFLGREPNSDEEQGWVQLLVQGHTEESVVGAMLGSEELTEFLVALGNTGTREERYVQGLFRTILGRFPEQPEAAAWLQAMTTLGRGGLATFLLRSQEYRLLVIDQLFRNCWNREGGQDELVAWARCPLDLGTIRQVFEAQSVGDSLPCGDVKMAQDSEVACDRTDPS